MPGRKVSQAKKAIDNSRPLLKETAVVVPIEKVATRANSKARANVDLSLANSLFCAQCEINYERGATGSSESLCSSCYVHPLSEDNVPYLKHVKNSKRKVVASATKKKKEKEEGY